MAGDYKGRVVMGSWNNTKKRTKTTTVWINDVNLRDWYSMIYNAHTKKYRKKQQ